MDDVWEYIDLLRQEAEYQHGYKGNTVDIVNDIYHQLPFFACKNNFLDPDVQNDINRYLYCKETGTQAYSGSYGSQPKTWKDKYFILHRAFQLRERIKQQKAQQEAKKTKG
tara:strand:+ start:11361 stop:11693 length:333 start_codon:yes stop_codon:yes gene_type:complete